MPVTPQSLGPRVRTDPLSAPLANHGMASAAAFGAPIGAGAREGLDSVGRGNAYAAAVEARQAEAAAKEQEDRDDIEAMDADNQLVDAANNLKASALQTQGKNVDGLNARTRADFDKLVEERTKEIKSPRAQAMFRQKAAKRWLTLDEDVAMHSEREFGKYKEATLQGGIEREGMEAVESMSSDPAKASEQIAEANRKRFLARQVLSGIKGVGMEAEHLKDQSALYSDATSRFLNNKDWKGATTFYEANKGHILDAARKPLEAAIKEGAIQGMTEEATAQITMPRDGAIPTRTQAMSAANQIKDPEVKSRTITAVKALYVEREQAHESDQTDKYNSLNKVLRENGGNMNALPAAEVASLDAKWWKTLQADAKDFVGEQTPTKQTYDNLAATDHIRMIIDQGKISSVESMRQGLVYGNYESEAEFPLTESGVRALAANNGLTAEQTKSVTEYMKQGGVKGTFKITQFERVYEMAAGNGRKYDDDRKKYPKLFELVRDRLPPGTEATDDAVLKAMSPLLAEGEIGGYGWSYRDSTYAGSRDQEERDKFLPTVEPKEQTAIASGIRQILKEQGKEGSVNITPAVIGKFKKYGPESVGGLNLPTPLRNGKPMTFQEAVFEGTFLGNKRDLPARVNQTPQQALDAIDPFQGGGL